MSFGLLGNQCEMLQTKPLFRMVARLQLGSAKQTLRAKDSAVEPMDVPCMIKSWRVCVRGQLRSTVTGG